MRIYFRNPVVLIFAAFCVLFLVWTFRGLDSASIHNFTLPDEQEESAPAKHKPEPTWTPPPIKDPFPLLEHSAPPPIPSYNVPREDLHKEYDLPLAPPLFIGFGRTWPILLQCVVSYITAGWPPEQIYVVENTGVQLSNAHGKLTLQNPFYLNYTVLQDRLGVKIIRTPTILNFAQMQNLFLNTALENNWEYYVFSHSDQLVFSLEEGKEGVTPPAGEEGYKPMYELVVESIRDVRASEPRWGKILYAFNDYLTTFNTKAMDELGGWDSMIPFYSTDCDMYSRMRMHNYIDVNRDAGHFNDVSTVLNDLRVLYRDTSIVPEMVELNPLPPGEEAHGRDGEYDVRFPTKRDETPPEEPRNIDWNNPKDYYRGLKELGDKMVEFKLSNEKRGRNTWQMSQRGGHGEPYYYPAEGIAEAIHVLTVAGRQTYNRKWGLEKCDLDSNGLRWEDAWHVEKGKNS